MIETISLFYLIRIHFSQRANEYKSLRLICHLYALKLWEPENTARYSNTMPVHGVSRDRNTDTDLHCRTGVNM
jgi:hypothetical protein